MAVSGRKPKEQKVTRHQLTQDWVEVPDVPYKGKKPPQPRGLPPATARWWKAITSMPHCALWTTGDWQFCLTTALIHATVMMGDFTRAGELRLRERQMGTTLDARRDLRIRYVEPPPEAERVEGEAGGEQLLSFEAERRRRLLG